MISQRILAGRRTFPVKSDIILLLGAGTKEMVPAFFRFAGRGSKALLPAEKGYETNIEKGS